MVKQLILASGAALMLPSCFENRNRTSIALKNIKVDGDQELMLANLTQTILPTTDTPGAKELNAHIFTLVMIDDCMDKKSQQKLMNGMKDFEKAAKEKFSNSFSESTAEQRTALVTELDKASKEDSDLQFFYANVKRFTVQAYTTSKYYLTKIQVYELVPGRYHGCVPLKPSPASTL